MRTLCLDPSRLLSLVCLRSVSRRGGRWQGLFFTPEAREGTESDGEERAESETTPLGG